MDLVKEQEDLVASIQAIAQSASKAEDVTRVTLTTQALKPAVESLATLKAIFFSV